MFGSASVEMEIKVGANEAWKVFGTLLISRLLIQDHPEISREMHVLEGDGGSGTLIQLTLPSGKINQQILHTEKSQFLVNIN